LNFVPQYSNKSLKMWPGSSMYRFACDSTYDYLLGCGHHGDLDIWQIPFKQTIYEFLKISHAKLSCDDFFIFCYWFCIVFAFVGFIEAILEFARLYNDEKYEPSTFWNRTYHHIPIEFQRKARFTGSITNIISSFCLIYGFVNFRFLYILPWLLTNVAVIALECIYWIIAGFSTKTFKLKPLQTILFLAVRLAIAIHVMLIIKASQI
jgi:hypothetical protein